MKRIKITERQREILLKVELNESKDYELILKKVVDDINLNYTPIAGTYRKGGEYFEKPMIKVEADGSMITPKDLLEYLNFKNKNLSDKFLKQVILDWVNGRFSKSKDYSLSKNITMS